jgi:hypothetical protein
MMQCLLCPTDSATELCALAATKAHVRKSFTEPLNVNVFSFLNIVSSASVRTNSSVAAEETIAVRHRPHGLSYEPDDSRSTRGPDSDLHLLGRTQPAVQLDSSREAGE